MQAGATTRDAILDAAERLFAEHGYRGTSLAEIGRAAGLSRGTPGYFFGSKGRLYRAVLARLLQRAGDTLRPVYARAEGSEQPLRSSIGDLVQAHLALLVASPSLLRLIQWETMNGGVGELSDELRKHARRLVELIRTLPGGYAPAEPDAVRLLLVDAVALCWFPLVAADSIDHMLGLDPRAPGVLERRAEAIADLLVSRLSRSTSTG